MTTPTDEKDQALKAQQFARRYVKEIAEQLEVCLSTNPGEEGVISLRFRYGRESEPFRLQGKTAREQARDMAVHIERFLGARK